MSKLKKPVTFLIKSFLTVSIASTIVACQDEQAPKEKVIRPAKVLQISDSEKYIRRTFPARIEANDEAVISFQVSGELIDFPVKEGLAVTVGQLIAKLDPQPFEDSVQKAQAQYNLAKSQYNRASELIKDGYISAADYDKKHSEFMVSESNLSTIKRDLDYSSIEAPFNGIVAKTYANAFEFIKAKQQILKIQDLSSLEVIVNIPEDLVLNIDKDEDIKTTVFFADQQDKQYNVNYKEHAAEADKQTNTYQTVFMLKNPAELNVMPGMSATLVAMVPDFQAASEEFYQIPLAAVIDSGDGKSSVWLMDPKSQTVSKHQVSVADFAQNSVKVTSGLKSGDLLVISGASYLTEGQKIRPIE